jgi:putative CocE/NonD family hydrolase
LTPDSGKFTYRYAPSQPVPTHGGPNLLIPAGSYDQCEIEQRDDVLVFSSEPLTRSLEVTGPIHAYLLVATSAADTDFTAKLTDVYPDGRSMLLVDGICRLSLRDRLDQPDKVTPGKTYRIDIDLWSTSYVFCRGHRIRLAISSSNSPRFEPHSNRLAGDEGPPIVATQTLMVGGEQASCLQLPVVE